MLSDILRLLIRIELIATMHFVNLKISLNPIFAHFEYLNSTQIVGNSPSSQEPWHRANVGVNFGSKFRAKGIKVVCILNISELCRKRDENIFE